MDASSSSSLSPAQVELLKLFSRDIPEKDWVELRQLIARFFAERSIEEANKVWDEKGWTEEDAERLLHGHFRKSSKP